MKKLILSFFILLIQAFQGFAQVDTSVVNNIIEEWNRAHNEHDPKLLTKVYAPKVLFYCKDLTNQECVKIKFGVLNKMPTYRQAVVSKIETTSYDSGVLKCDFTKEVSTKGFATKDYASYLLLKSENGVYSIVGESDDITDRNLNYHLNIGNPINPNEISSSTKTIALYSLLAVLGLCFIIIVIYFVKKKSGKVPTREDISDVIISKTSTVDLVENSNQSVNLITSSSDYIKSIDIEKHGKRGKEYLGTAVTQTKTAVTKFLDLIDGLDRFLYGQRMRYFILGSFLVLVVAPITDYFIGDKSDLVTFCSTFAFLLFNMILVISFISSWRDDTGNWSFERAKSKMVAYFESIRSSIGNVKASPLDERLYKLGRALFLGGICWEALSNASVVIRNIFEKINMDLGELKKFERFTHFWFSVPIILGLGIILYLYNQNPIILKRVQNELRQLLGLKLNEDSLKAYDNVPDIKTNLTEFVINGKTENHLTYGIESHKHNILNDFAIAIKAWNPQNSSREYEYQDRLANHLKRHLPDAVIKTEYPIGEKSMGNRGRADIVINDTILLELKRDSSSGAIQRAKGQIAQYSEIWKEKGVVILVLCDYEYEHARLVYSSTMSDLAKLNRPVFAIVAKPKKVITKELFTV